MTTIKPSALPATLPVRRLQSGWSRRLQSGWSGRLHGPPPLPRVAWASSSSKTPLCMKLFKYSSIGQLLRAAPASSTPQRPRPQLEHDVHGMSIGASIIPIRFLAPDVSRIPSVIPLPSQEVGVYQSRSAAKYLQTTKTCLGLLSWSLPLKQTGFLRQGSTAFHMRERSAHTTQG